MSPPLNFSWIRFQWPRKPPRLSSGRPPRPCARCAGRTSCDSRSEKIRQMMTTLPITSKTCPIGPGTIVMGVNVATVVSTPKITGTETS